MLRQLPMLFRALLPTSQMRWPAAESEGRRGPRLRTLPADCCLSLAPVRRTRLACRDCPRLAECWARAQAQLEAWQEVALLPQPPQTLPPLPQQLERQAQQAQPVPAWIPPPERRCTARKDTGLG